MPYFECEDDAVKALGGFPKIEGWPIPPRNMPKRKLAQWKAPGPVYKGENCECKARPFTDGTYLVSVDPDCKAHKNLRGNTTAPSKRRGLR